MIDFKKLGYSAPDAKLLSEWSSKAMADPKVPVKPVEIVKPARNARKPVDPNESKADKFRRLANNRVPRILKLMRMVGALGNKSQYEANDEQLAKILQAIQEGYAAMKQNLYGQCSEESGFRL